METSFIICIGIMMLSAIALAFFAGIIAERQAWDKLIREGKLPRPRNHLGEIIVK